MNTITQCFKIILNGNKEASRKAARQVRKLLYSGVSDKAKFKEIKRLVSKAPEEYKKISESWRQENFVVAVSVIYYLHDKEQKPDFLFPWLFNLLQHPNGNIRHASVRMFSNELGPLTVHLRFPKEADRFKNKAAQEQANVILCELHANLIALLNDLWEPKYKRYKYINSLPTSPYKSVQMALANIDELCQPA